MSGVALIDEALLAVTMGLSQNRNAFAVIRDEFDAGIVSVVGYCRLPTAAVEAATALTTELAPPGVRYKAVTMYRAEALAMTR